MVCGLCLAGIVCSSARAGSIYLLAAGGYFQPRDQAFKDVYGNSLAFGVQADVGVWKGLSLWAGIGYVSRKGELTLTEQETKLRIAPVFGGVKFRFLKAAPVRPYVAFGVGYFIYKETSPLGAVDGSDIGYVGQAGISVKTIRSLSLELYARYSDCRTRPADLEVNLGGFELGVGLGYEF
jgi:hypothetical protein